NTVSTPVNNGDTTTSVKTGDESLVGMFTSLGLLASLGAIACLKKRKNN
ncbi:MAG: LPXTG cell wall anchor domain-containing protein, partial [Thomasclavelia spiroformis]